MCQCCNVHCTCSSLDGPIGLKSGSFINQSKWCGEPRKPRLNLGFSLGWTCRTFQTDRFVSFWISSQHQVPEQEATHDRDQHDDDRNLLALAQQRSLPCDCHPHCRSSCVDGVLVWKRKGCLPGFHPRWEPSVLDSRPIILRHLGRAHTQAAHDFQTGPPTVENICRALATRKL